ARNPNFPETAPLSSSSSESSSSSSSPLSFSLLLVAYLPVFFRLGFLKSSQGSFRGGLEAEAYAAAIVIPHDLADYAPLSHRTSPFSAISYRLPPQVKTKVDAPSLRRL